MSFLILSCVCAYMCMGVGVCMYVGEGWTTTQPAEKFLWSVIIWNDLFNATNLIWKKRRGKNLGCTLEWLLIQYTRLRQLTKLLPGNLCLSPFIHSRKAEIEEKTIYSLVHHNSGRNMIWSLTFVLLCGIEPLLGCLLLASIRRSFR